ncbi:MAG: NUDIX hydrolase [Acidimicrobiia bacterium]|nr:NUDIX hydrolase [Acidimicrobiia bacterium]
MKILSSKEFYSNDFFRVTEDLAVDPGGFKIKRAIVHHRGSAVMMAVDDRRRVLMVRQFRLPARQSMWELPAGKVDEGETPLSAAKRELREETGYTARRWQKLVSYYASPGFLSEKMNIFLATGLRAGPSDPMDDERIECRWFTRRELEEGILKGKIIDGKTMAGLLAWKLRRADK